MSPAAPTLNQREAYLIARIKAGDRSLFYELIQPYQRTVYAAAYSVLGNPTDAEDAAQEAFLKALTHIGQFRSEAKFSTWLVQITLNEARLRLRSFTKRAVPAHVPVLRIQPRRARAPGVRRCTLARGGRRAW